MENNNLTKIRKIGNLIAITGFFSILSGFCFWGYQIYVWLRTGEWVAYSILWPLSYLKSLEYWVYYPTEWVGVHKIMEELPFFLSLIMFGIGLLVYGIFFSTKQE